MAIVTERVQTGIRVEKRTLKVLKALAEYLDLSLGDLLEGIVLHAFEGRAPFGAESLAQIGRLRDVYGLGLTAADGQLVAEEPVVRPAAKRGAAKRGQVKPVKRARAGVRPSARGKAGRRRNRAAV